MRKRNVYISPDRPPPEEAHEFVEVPRGNDRFWNVELHNRGRVQRGTCTCYRMMAICNGIKGRWGTYAIRSNKKMFVTELRKRDKFGPLIARFTNLPGPVASVATKH